jgi:hypothetical protein
MASPPASRVDLSSGFWRPAQTIKKEEDTDNISRRFNVLLVDTNC